MSSISVVEIKGYTRKVLVKQLLSNKSRYLIMDLLLRDEDTVNNLGDIFSIAKNDDVEIHILSIIGFNSEIDVADDNADNIESKMDELINSGDYHITFPTPYGNDRLVYSISDPDNEYIDNYGTINYSLKVKYPTFLADDSGSDCWKIELNQNVNIIPNLFSSTRKGLSAEIGIGKIIQYDKNSCGNSDTSVEKSFIYGNIGVVYSLIPSEPMADTTYMTLIQTIIEKFGIKLSVSSSSFNMADMKIDGGFVTSKKHKLENFENSFIVNCTVGLDSGTAISANAKCSLIAIVIPFIEDNSTDETVIQGEIVGTIIAGAEAGVSFDTKIQPNASLSISAGFLYMT